MNTRGWVLGAVLVAAIPDVAVAQQATELRAGLVITRSTRITPRTYRLAAAASPDSAVVVIRGDSITVDFSGAVMEGIDPAADPDLAQGVAIRVEGGRGVRILNARVRGYKIGILARDTRGLDIIDTDLSYNWKPRLFSLVEHESLVDWLSFHNNEKDEWLRYGAAIYLSGVTGGEIRGNRVEQGMNGLLMVRSDRLVIRDNNFSFNSGLGIGLYRSNENRIVHNRLDYNVRGYSHRFYRRGQDSAGLLLYEQSSRNIVAYNSATHGGDGLFLWAGQSTMDSGQGGANDNLFYANDFSYAPANGIEATFSHNTFIANRAVGNDYGFWGGYSYDSKIIGNCFALNRVGVAIEHGNGNLIAVNVFDRDSTAISLWANPTQPAEWGYVRHRDTQSHDYHIGDNLFAGNRVGVRGVRTSRLILANNRARGVDSLTVLRDTSEFNLIDDAVPGAGAGVAPEDATCPPRLIGEYALMTPPPLPGNPTEVPASPLAQRDRSAIVVDQWGPFDWRSPMLWSVDSVRARPVRLATGGPAGSWTVVTRRGVRDLSAATGSIGDTLLVTPAADSSGDWEVTLEYRGAETMSPRGARRAAGDPYRFGFGHFEPAIDWNVRFFALTDSAARGKPEAYTALFAQAPLLTRRVPRLDYQWYRPTIAEVPREHWALEATSSVILPPGQYTVRTISDDGIRVWVDDRLVIDAWAPHESRIDHAVIAPGRHTIKVQYYQVGGWTELRVDIVRGSERSTGSPGAH